MIGLPILPPDPEVALAWIRDYHRSSLWSKQQDAVRLVFGGRHKKTSIRSNHAAGKTRLAAELGVCWLCTGQDRMLITTAPTGRQVKDLLWKEIRKIAAALKMNTGWRLPMPPRAPEIRMHPDHPDWYGIGFSSKDPVNFQGPHPPGGVLIILDEAPGVPERLWDAMDGIMTGEHDRLLAIGNPTKSSGAFYDSFRKGTFNNLHISAFDTPNVIAGRTVIPGLVTLDWVNRMRAEWGEGSAMWKSKVLGEFPDDAANTLLPVSWLEAANERWLDLEAIQEDREADAGLQDRRHGLPSVTELPVWDNSAEQHAGMDVARGGQNETTLANSQAQGVRWIHTMGRDFAAQGMALHDITGATTGWVIGEMDASPRVSQLRIDGDGVGGDVYQAAYRHFQDNRRRRLSVVEMRGGMPSDDVEHFTNSRSQWLWNIRRGCDPNNPNPIALPPNAKLQAQATSILWSHTDRGQIRLETKKEMAARLSKERSSLASGSPDELDAVAYSMAKVDIGAPAPTWMPQTRRENYWAGGG